MAAPELLTAFATRPYPGETANGDAWRLDGENGRYRLALVDGLGHGPEAALAAQQAMAALAGTPTLGPAESIQACHQALRGTRGAALSVVCLDLLAGELRYAGVGNVEVQFWRPERLERPIAYRGIVGVVMRTVREFVLPLDNEWLLVMHTDGVRSHFDLPSLPEFQRRSVDDLVAAVLSEWGRPNDDATVVAAQLSPRREG